MSSPFADDPENITTSGDKGSESKDPLGTSDKPKCDPLTGTTAPNPPVSNSLANARNRSSDNSHISGQSSSSHKQPQPFTTNQRKSSFQFQQNQLPSTSTNYNNSCQSSSASVPCFIDDQEQPEILSHGSILSLPPEELELEKSLIGYAQPQPQPFAPLNDLDDVDFADAYGEECDQLELHNPQNNDNAILQHPSSVESRKKSTSQVGTSVSALASHSASTGASVAAVEDKIIRPGDENLIGQGMQSISSGPSRKKSILRAATGSSSNGSFNATSSSIISDGKLGSMNSSFNSSQFYNNFYSRAAQRHDFQRYTRGPYAPLDRCNSTSASSASSSTITQHYYPEGGWGFVVLLSAIVTHALLCGFLLSGGVFAVHVLMRFDVEKSLRMPTVWLVSLAHGGSLLLSPLWVSICKRKSTRLSAVFGGLVTSLGCLFTSFASQFHQLFFSYVIFMGVGVGLTKDASELMVGQYFKRRRDLVEILLVSGSGLGILLMSFFLENSISSVGWRLGLQAVTGTLVVTFFLGSCYRSASLYHPQRRAIVHLKNQKRKIKEKEKKSDRPPFLDLSCLASRSLQALLISCAFSAWGFFSPLFHLALECFDEAVDEMDKLLIYIYMGTGWIIGCFVFGFLAVQRNEDCRVSKLYLCQLSALILGASLIALGGIREHSGLVTFSWIYGIGLGGYQCTLKLHVYETFRARVFPRAWSFVQCIQGAALLLGVPVTGYVNRNVGWRTGYYYVCAGPVFLGFLIMFLSAVGNRSLTRHKSNRSSMKTCETSESLQSPTLRRISFTFPDDQMSPHRLSKENRSSCSEKSMVNVNCPNAHNNSLLEPPIIPKELTRISEEGVLDTAQ